ncbi:MFS transporter [Luteimicrobium subarcticum]|uniref:Putative MFS family arabinose efflux permease n=1 Tax=Luteimicrobium subarcticum TaxID=620910 RepID=A0A2M8WV23_9MICO|nr:MFS transporter [Luteimicrobium subarcticum]PJI94773.1 putative MFS family arabinose efflux permease [Luteimicrobium subarcticum]
MTDPAVAPPRRSLVHHRDFRALWTGDALGQLGAQLATLAVPVLAVQTLHADAWQMGALTAAETAAFLVIGLPAGAWVDRMRKRRVLIGADLVRAAALGGVVACAAAGVLSMPVLYAAALVMSCATVFFDVAHQSYVPGLIGLDHVVEGNAKLQATASVAQVAGPALGGVLLRVVTAPALLVVNAATYLLSVVFVARIRADERLPPREERGPLVHEIREGLAFVAHQPLLVRIVVCTSIGNLGWSVVSALLTLYALRDLGLTAAGLGVALSAASVGGLLGALLGERVARRVGEARVIPLAAVALALPMACVPLAGVLPWNPEVTLAAGLAVAYFALVVFNIAAVSFRQRLCPPRLLGRMNASVRFVVWGTMPVGGLLGGWLGTTVGVVPAIWVGVTTGVLAALPVLASPLLTMTTLPEPAEHPGIRTGS